MQVTETEDPDFLSNLLGGFNEATYEDDLESFPDCFDENGWPLLGIYDPYTLKHPITGVSWHLAPRVPTNDEVDPEYEDWFELAERFADAGLTGRIRTKPDVPEENPGISNVLYDSSSKKAADGNLAHLRTHVLPKLTELFEQRHCSPRFSLLWGDYCRIRESIGVAVPAMIRRKAGRETDQSSQFKHAQVKWYLRWRRRHVDELGKALSIANVESKTKCPDGFDIEWFRKTQLNFEKATRERPAFSEWGLARALSNSNRHPLKSELLKQNLIDEPRIPSVELDRFQYCKGLS